MKAILLNSGVGRRLKPITDNTPKCLVEINEQTILGHEIDNLLHHNIKDFIITIGPFGDKIKNFVKEKYPDLNVEYVYNPKFESTNYIYSMWLVKNFIDDDVLIMHGDMVFDKKLLSNLFNKDENCVLVNNKIEPPEKDFKGEIQDNMVKRIGVDVFGEGCHFLAPIYKFSKDSFISWLTEIENFIFTGNVNVYAEEAFNNIADELKLMPVYYGDEFCMEIDNLEDLEIAKKFFTNSEKAI
tara:strand:+ start:257 stop:979 length:723 start_codon:yes stop_codon:yes gene_type:complete